jgi:AmpD protein
VILEGEWLETARRVLSPNRDARPAQMPVELIILHNISLPPGCFDGDAVERLFTNDLDLDAHPYHAQLAGLRVSAHLFLRRDGQWIQFVPFGERAWHAGVSSWQGRERCNDFSIGIEIEGTDELTYDDRQYEALGPVIEALASAFPVRAVVGHCDVAPTRKTDPGPAFDWTRIGRFARR